MIAVLFCELALFAAIAFPPQARYVDSSGVVLSASTDNSEVAITVTVVSAVTDNIMSTFTPTAVPMNTVIPTKTTAAVTKPTTKPTAKPTITPTIKPTIKPTETLKPTPTKTVIPTQTPILPPTFTRTPTPTLVPTTAMATCDLNYSLALLAEINKYRSQNGKPAYIFDTTISIAACNHSNWMLTTGIFSHTGIDGSTAAQRCAKIGTKCSGENITTGNSSYILPANVVQRWSGSPPHNANMLSAYTYAGIGKNGNYVTVDFAF